MLALNSSDEYRNGQIFADLVIPGNILYARLIMIQRHETHLIFITEIGIGIETEFLVAFERHVIKYPQRSVPLAIDIHRSTGTYLRRDHTTSSSPRYRFASHDRQYR